MTGAHERTHIMPASARTASHRLAAVCVVAISAALAGSACSSDPTNPTGPPAAEPAPLFLESHATAVPLGWLSDSGVLRPDRDLRLQAGNVTVSFPHGSVATQTAVTLRVIADEELQFEIEPAGLQLMVPASIELRYLRLTDARRYDDLFVLIADGEAWTPLESNENGDRLQAVASQLGFFAIGGTEAGSGEEIEFVRWLASPGHATALISADRGGKLRYGRFELDFPSGALTEDTWITIRNPGDGYVTCELEPHGLQFLVPVELTISLSGLRTAPYTDWTVFWLDDSSGGWMDMGGSFQTGRVRLYLDHFSTYRPGRAGW